MKRQTDSPATRDRVSFLCCRARSPAPPGPGRGGASHRGPKLAAPWLIVGRSQTCVYDGKTGLARQMTASRFCASAGDGCPRSADAQCCGRHGHRGERVDFPTPAHYADNGTAQEAMKIEIPQSAVPCVGGCEPREKGRNLSVSYAPVSRTPVVHGLPCSHNSRIITIERSSTSREFQRTYICTLRYCFVVWRLNVKAHQENSRTTAPKRPGAQLQP